MKKHYKIETEPLTGPIEIKIVLGKKQFTEPKLYIAKETINGKKRPCIKAGKRWYIWFLWRNPETDKLDIKIKTSEGINRLKTVQERKDAGNAVKKALSIALHSGWIPPQVRDESKPKSRQESKSVREALEYAFEIKKRELKESTVDDYRVRLNFFLDWASKKLYTGLAINDLNIEHIYEYVDFLQLEYRKPNKEFLSNTSVDNYKRGLSALFTVLQHKRIIPHNFLTDIPRTKGKPVKNKPFTNSELLAIKKQLQKKDPYLINVISLMLYPLLRPVEIVRLKVSDINTEDWILGIETKTRSIGYSRIIDRLKPLITKMELDKYPGHYNLITKMDEPAVWETEKLGSKVKLFSQRFTKVIRPMGFGKEYGLYSCRHSAIIDLYNSPIHKGMSEQEIILNIMPITGHKSEAGLRNYLRDIQAMVPEDHSNLYTIDF